MKDELKGLSIKKEVVLKCGDCGFPLAEIVLTNTKEELESRGESSTRVKYKVVDCYKCGGSSFETEIFEGNSITGPIRDSDDVFAVDAEQKDDYILATLNVTRR